MLEFTWSIKKVKGPKVSVVVSVDTIDPKMTDTLTDIYLQLAKRQREGFKEWLDQLQMNKAKKSRSMTQAGKSKPEYRNLTTLPIKHFKLL